MENNLTPVAEQIQALTSEQQQTAFNCGKVMAINELEVIEQAKTYAKMLGTEPNYSQWENGRVQWIAGHVEGNPDLTGNAHDKAWEVFSIKLNQLFGLTKPESKSPAAAKKRAERAANEQALLKQHENTSPDQLRQQLEKAHLALAKNPENKAAEKLSKDLKKVLKVKTAEQSKARMELLAGLREQIREAAKKCTEEETLQAALDILSLAADFEYAAEVEAKEVEANQS